MYKKLSQVVIYGIILYIPHGEVHKSTGTQPRVEYIATCPSRLSRRHLPLRFPTASPHRTGPVRPHRALSTAMTPHNPTESV